MLVICGLYQLFGRFFKTRLGSVIPGIGILDVETHGTDERLIGNVKVSTAEFGSILGYENHSGQTTLGPGVEPLGTTAKGTGNNSSDGQEGARYRNIVASYLHGSLLPKNPAIADFLIRTAVERKYGSFTPGDPGRPLRGAGARTRRPPAALIRWQRRPRQDPDRARHP